jgi:hypothetical protein
MKHVLLTLLIAVTCTSITAQLPSYLPTNGLVGWWPFNGNANDESGNGNHGTVNGATLAEDRFGNLNSAYSFDGIDDKVMAAVNTQYNSSWSLSFWFFSANLNSSFTGQNIIGIGQDLHGFGSSAFQIAGDIQPGQCSNFNYSNQMYLFDATEECGGNYISGGQYLNNVWSKITIIKQSGYFSIYVDGLLISANNSQMQSIIPDQLTFGNRALLNFQFFNGLIDDIAIYNRALTPEEITALYTGIPADNNSTANTSAMLPQAISYQAVARDPQGAVLNNASVQVQFTMLADSLTGTAEYVETHALTTNSLGLFTTAFGAGTAVSGTFAAINWTTGNKYLNVQIDTGSGWVDIGTQQLLSVPYSMHSATAGSIKNPGLPIYPDNAAAITGGLNVGQMYRTATGDLKIVY